MNGRPTNWRDAGGRSATNDISPGGLLPVLPPGAQPGRSSSPSGKKDARSNAATAASAAGVRAFTAQLVTFYFRAPVKAFFRTRVDYLAFARSVHQQRYSALTAAAAAAASSSSSSSPGSVGGGGVGGAPLLARLRGAVQWMRHTTPAVLGSAIRHYGWRVVPDQVLPPLVANVGVGAVLYTSYLHLLGALHEPSATASKRVYPPPEPAHTAAAGLLAGGLQSLVAAPLDAIQARFEGHPVLEGGGGGGNAPGAAGVRPPERPQSMWAFGGAKLREIGLRGIFAGWSLSFAKDSLGCAVFFSTFEWVKAQGYYRFVTWYYGSSLAGSGGGYLLSPRPVSTGPGGSAHEGGDGEDGVRLIRPHYAIEPMFLMLAGTGASFAQQLILHPLTHVQMEHWERLEDIDAKVRRLREAAGAGAAKGPTRRWRMFRAYYHAYRETWAQCVAQAAGDRVNVARWLYRGFWWNTIRQVPSTSAGLIIFELVRRRYGFGEKEVRINSDGYDILLS